MRFGFLCIDNVCDFRAAHLQEIGNQGAMATPPDCFRAHDHGGPGFTSESEKTLDTFLKLLCLHVIGVTAKGSTAPGCIARIRSRFPPSAQLGKMFIMNSAFLE